ncbi:MAG TPA: MFS transporter, partial [Bacillales bacterium]|nr:MFS transporter [Bacillales bacterium]
LALMGLYLAGELYFSFHYPAVFALTQEMFPKKWYVKINSVMEIQGQTAGMLAGGLAGILVQHWGLANILWVDAGTYLVSFILYGFLKYQHTARPEERERKVTFLSDVQEGWAYLKVRPRMIIFFLATFIPFLVVLVTNYLFPVFVAHTLHASATVFATYEVIFAAGAVCAGTFVGLLNNRLGLKKVLVLNASLFTLAIFLIAFIPSVAVFLALQAVLGWGNAGIRINRKTLMMEEVPNRLIGRVNSFYASVGIAIRVTLIGSFTLSVSHTGASFSVLILGIILVLAVASIVVSRNFSGVKLAQKPEGKAL